MVSALFSGSCSLGSSPGQGQDTLVTVPLSIPVYQWVPGNSMLGVNL